MFGGFFAGKLASAEAKRQYFLTPDDLLDLHYESFGGGIGCGAPRKYYTITDLQARSLRKHGEAGLAKKVAARNKRESNKRQRQEEAASFEADLLNGGGAPAPKKASLAGHVVDLTSDDDTATVQTGHRILRRSPARILD